jgi:dTDP-6-deoxy-L-talose 4-dehydrogenase (NAD+)
MKKVLVTGATGFIGNYVIDELLKRNYEVVATSVSAEKARSRKWYDKVKYIPFDLKTVSEQEDYYALFGRPDLLIHLAWEGLPNYKSAFHVEENLPRHYTFIKNLVQHGLKDISITGTCFEYGMQEGCLSEDMQSLPSNSYAIAKNNLRILLSELAKTNPFDMKWIRLFYMYGKGQNPNSLFSQLQLALDRGDKVFDMSPGDQLRDYLPVEKVAEYIVEIALQNSKSGIINCCSGSPVSVKDIVLNYLKQRNTSIALNTGYYPYPDIEPRNFWGDATILKTILTEVKKN